MPVDRPTFSESWYRVAAMCPRLRSTVQTYRQHYRGQMWHVLQDPTSNQFFRLSDEAYRLVAMLDGRRTVADAWAICNEEGGDAAPTQGEAIQILGQLYSSNLLQAEMSPDTEGLFRRYQKRIRREVRSYMASLLFARIPLLDPDRFLDRWVGLFGGIFSIYGMVVWMILVGAGLYSIAGSWGDLAKRAQQMMMSPEDLPLLYLSFVLVKICHEFGHAFACKKFGRDTGSGGEVHVMGVMFLVFTPLPYVDASSAWAFRSKWRRVMTGAAGMFVEFAVAAVAAVIWANTGEGLTKSICYNVMFIASVSSLLFNGNPLLRYDAYYILADLLEIPNLAQRSKDYLYYLVKRYVWSVRQPRNPAHTGGERFWFVLYGVASTLYRIFIFSMILMFLTDRLPRAFAMVAVAFGAVAGFTWVCVPLGKLVHYLATNNELLRVRGRAVLSSIATAIALVALVGFVPLPDRFRIEGVVRPVEMAFVHARESGFIDSYTPTGQVVSAGEPLVVAVDPELTTRLKQVEVERDRLKKERSVAVGEKEWSTVFELDDKLRRKDQDVDELREQVAALTIQAPFAGRWISPDIDDRQGDYLKGGDQIGQIASEEVVIRAPAGQNVPFAQAFKDVTIRARGRPMEEISGTMGTPRPATKVLPSPALGLQAAGSHRTDVTDRQGMRTEEHIFEIPITPGPSTDAGGGVVKLFSGQRVIVRLEMPAKPLIAQIWRKVLQMVEYKKPKSQ